MSSRIAEISKRWKEEYNISPEDITWLIGEVKRYSGYCDEGEVLYKITREGPTSVAAIRYIRDILCVGLVDAKLIYEGKKEVPLSPDKIRDLKLHKGIFLLKVGEEEVPTKKYLLLVPQHPPDHIPAIRAVAHILGCSLVSAREITSADNAYPLTEDQFVRLSKVPNLQIWPDKPEAEKVDSE